MAKMIVERRGLLCRSDALAISALKNPLNDADGHPGIFSEKKYRRPALIYLMAPGSPWTVPLFFITFLSVFIPWKGLLFVVPARNRILITRQIFTSFARIPVII
jgi:hypothetical protein